MSLSRAPLPVRLTPLVGRELPEAPPPAPSLPREGGVFRRFLDGFRYDSEA